MRWRTSTITAIPLPPHQLARQRFNRFPEAPVTWHIEQLVDDLLQRRRINDAGAPSQFPGSCRWTPACSGDRAIGQGRGGFGRL